MNRILVVEDEGPLALALQDNLEALGYVVEVALNGEEAMQHIEKNRPNLILLDLLMPKKDGFFVLEQVKRSPELKLIPIIVLSNIGGDIKVFESEGDFSEIAMYADDYFVKSQHTIVEIIARVKDYMDGKVKSKNTPSEK